MSGTPWRREGFGLQDLEAPFSRTDDVVRSLGVADRQERDHATGAYGGGAISTWRVVGPGSAPGRHLVTPPGQSDRTIELPGPSGAFRPGSYVMVGQDRNGGVVLSAAPAGLAGASGFALDAPPLGVVRDFKIQSIASDPFVAGSSDNVLTLSGYGLDGTETAYAAVYNPSTRAWDVDPNIRIHSPVNIDGETMTVLADLGPGVPPTYAITLRYSRP